MIVKFLKMLVLPVLIGIAIWLSNEEEPLSYDSVDRPSADMASDGDSLNLGDGNRIRLYAVDAPELAQTCLRADETQWPCGKWAQEQLAAMIDGGTVECATIDRDRYGRKVARCANAGADDIGAALVRKGAAVALRIDGKRPYAMEEAEAQKAGRGIWQGAFQIPSAWRADHPRN